MPDFAAFFASGQVADLMVAVLLVELGLVVVDLPFAVERVPGG